MSRKWSRSSDDRQHYPWPSSLGHRLVPLRTIEGHSILEGIFTISRDWFRCGNEGDVINTGVHPCRRDILLLIECVMAPLMQPAVAMGTRIVLAAIARRMRRTVSTCVRRDFTLDDSEERTQCGQ